MCTQTPRGSPTTTPLYRQKDNKFWPYEFQGKKKWSSQAEDMHETFISALLPYYTVFKPQYWTIISTSVQFHSRFWHHRERHYFKQEVTLSHELNWMDRECV